MALQVKVRKARLRDAGTIAEFINQANLGEPITRLQVAERFSQVGFLLAEYRESLLGLLGWQVENLVVRITDFLIAPGADRMEVGRALIEAMESEGEQLQAEAVMLFLPPNPSKQLVEYWAQFGYQPRPVAELPKAWRIAAAEWNREATHVIVKQLREELVNRPI